MNATTEFKQMDPYCERHGTFHAEGACDLIDELRARLSPSTVDQLSLLDAAPKMLCVACGETVDGDASFCDPCEAAIRVAEHRGISTGLTAGQRAAIGLDNDDEEEAS